MKKDLFLNIVVVATLGMSHVSHANMTDDEINAFCPQHKAQGISPEAYRDMSNDMNELSCFSEGLATAVRGFKRGYVNTQLEWVIPAEYEVVNPFSGGRALVSKALDKYGYHYIDKHGKPINDASYKQAESFSEGMAAVKIHDRWGYINTSGKLVIPPRYGHASHFQYGFASVTVTKPEHDTLPYGKGSHTGAIDKQGKWLIPPEYDLVHDFEGGFENGLAQVKKGDGVGLVNTKGEFVVPLWTYSKIGRVSDGLILAEKDTRYTGFIDVTAKEVIPFEYDRGLPFYQGKAFVEKERTWFIIDKTNKTLKKLPYSYIRPTFDSKRFTASQLINGKELMGVIDNEGKVVIPVKFDALDYTGESTLAVKLNGKYVRIDKTGRVVSEEE